MSNNVGQQSAMSNVVDVDSYVPPTIPHAPLQNGNSHAQMPQVSSMHPQLSENYSNHPDMQNGMNGRASNLQSEVNVDAPPNPRLSQFSNNLGQNSQFDANSMNPNSVNPGNSQYADNLAYVNATDPSQVPYGQSAAHHRAKALFDDGSGNTGIEIIRLNKKFDIFMKRFMRAEEDIKEVKQNFYRVMHCAFAKYEQGFKRKNEYLERRRVKRKEEIERGVQQELKKRGMAGELDDPLLLSSVPGGTQLIQGSTVGGTRSSYINVMGKGDDDSSMGMNMVGGNGGLGGDGDSMMNIGKLGAASGMGVDDSELSNNAIGIPQSKKSTNT